MRKVLFFMLIVGLILLGLLVEKAEIYSNQISDSDNEELVVGVQEALTLPTTSEPERRIVHKAIRGCVLTGSDVITGKVTYRRRCTMCNYIDDGSTSTYLNQDGQVYKTTFHCPKCSNEQELIITTEVK